MAKYFLIIGCICAGLGVALGAFGAHALKERLSEDMLAIYHTGVHYHLLHSLALVISALLLRSQQVQLVEIAGWLFLTGIIIFSGSLYVLSLSGIRVLGAITPLGGLAFIAGWMLLALGVYRHWT